MARDADFRRELGQQLRVDSVRATAAAGSGHPTSSMSAADLMAVLLDGHLKLDYANPKNPANDHLIFSKGHASPLYYSILKAVGAIDDEELLTFRKLGSRLEGHPTPRIPPTDVATGSLGQGLPIGVGVAMAGTRAGPAALPRVGAVRRLRDGRGLDVGGLPARRLGGPRQPDRDHRRQPARADARDDARLGPRRLRAPRSRPSAGTRSRSTATTSRRSRPPTRRPRRPRTGRRRSSPRPRRASGVKAVEDQPGKHGKPLDDPEAAIEELGGERDLTVEVAKPARRRAARLRDERRRAADLGARRRGGHAQGLRRRAGRSGATCAATSSRSTARSPTRRTPRTSARRTRTATSRCSSPSSSWSPPRSGMQVRGWTPFASTFAAFLSRAYDFVRMAAISRAEPAAVGLARRRVDRRGRPVADGARGHRVAARHPRHRPSCTRPTPTRRRSSWPQMADREGISFMRTLRGQDPGPHRAGRGRPRSAAAASRTRVRRRRDRRLRDHASTRRSRPPSSSPTDGIHARVIDCYSIKPIDAEAVRAAARECGAIVTVEDHWPEGGLGDAVLEALAAGDERAHVVKLAVREMPGSGTPAELLHGREDRRRRDRRRRVKAGRRSGLEASSSWVSRSSRHRTRRPGPSERSRLRSPTSRNASGSGCRRERRRSRSGHSSRPR